MDLVARLLFISEFPAKKAAVLFSEGFTALRTDDEELNDRADGDKEQAAEAIEREDTILDRVEAICDILGRLLIDQ